MFCDIEVICVNFAGKGPNTPGAIVRIIAPVATYFVLCVISEQEQCLIKASISLQGWGGAIGWQIVEAGTVLGCGRGPITLNSYPVLATLKYTTGLHASKRWE